MTICNNAPDISRVWRNAGAATLTMELSMAAITRPVSSTGSINGWFAADATASRPGSTETPERAADVALTVVMVPSDGPNPSVNCGDRKMRLFAHEDKREMLRYL